MSFLVPLPKSWLESCKCSDAAERHLAASGEGPGISRMDFDEGAARASRHARQATRTRSAEDPLGGVGGGKSCARHSGLLTTRICAQFGAQLVLRSELSKLSKSITVKLECSRPDRVPCVCISGWAARTSDKARSLQNACGQQSPCLCVRRGSTQKAAGTDYKKKPTQPKTPKPTTNQNDTRPRKQSILDLSLHLSQGSWGEIKSNRCEPPHCSPVTKLAGPVSAPLRF